MEEEKQPLILPPSPKTNTCVNRNIPTCDAEITRGKRLKERCGARSCKYDPTLCLRHWKSRQIEANQPRTVPSFTMDDVIQQGTTPYQDEDVLSRPFDILEKDYDSDGDTFDEGMFKSIMHDLKRRKTEYITHD